MENRNALPCPARSPGTAQSSDSALGPFPRSPARHGKREAETHPDGSREALEASAAFKEVEKALSFREDHGPAPSKTVCN
ncbi:uncharacterized protein LOC144337003 isoform X2 [Macaca mulatta]